MGRMGNFTASDLKRLQNQLNKIQTGNAGAFAESCAKELAARLLVKVIKRTPIGITQEILILVNQNNNIKDIKKMARRVVP